VLTASVVFKTDEDDPPTYELCEETVELDDVGEYDIRTIVGFALRGNFYRIDVEDGNAELLKWTEITLG